MIRVKPHARRHEDRAGDPLDGLVNLFDLGIVLSVGFLLAALSSLNLAGQFTDGRTAQDDTITVPQDAETGEVPADGQQVVGNGAEVGKVYRLDDGRLVYVVEPGSTASSSPSASTTSSPPAP
ncbi:DUF2149 domain-containing protein [Nocardioides anomalus]|uniref:DUF2149 domain-containing protein n=1 Tax=Nocardioides anomalus TaxID=2712223 RepID=A0A6G6W9L6_9ACTN|nr:DUF2149 domain-containing protein [Nocardioides anomalus]QIG41843.1 DUF2149 domain-containing protein [Nocardioides anomalus]